MSVKFNTIPEAIAAIKNGEVIIVVDDENRENEGDFVAAAESITPDAVIYGYPRAWTHLYSLLTESRCKQLELQSDGTTQYRSYGNRFHRFSGS